MTDSPTAADILADLVSGDASRALSGSHAVIRAERATVEELAPHAVRIDRATDDLDYGGALHSNANHVVQAVRVLQAAAAGECECTTWHGWLFYEPTKLVAAGKAEILSTSEPGWSMTYECRCTACGATYSVEQGDYHYTWWQWSKPPKKKRARQRYRLSS
ncbi:hypothetical protein [Serinibacter arcticus]|uniref:Uncharacterized protein n=1 Tax=Serinibacter arcticus TaxID=1655435 RepID=A0A4Z1E3P5_9MICO|nr:hypothetical protein [Serinibacter arcticus]TGO05382.1 hypothetical protein SERN_1386 [Serinibacter arcticus]